MNDSKGLLDELFRRCRDSFETQPVNALRGAAYYVANRRVSAFTCSIVSRYISKRLIGRP
ncbi:MAG: hypothetical protein JWQ42_1580 [Edaphobacter sp.]|nr:hypothetical protein [Edaphobacter sp.]